ncbi:MAG: FAD-dependent oxidoreductase [Deltaproteobacteria bacterium]|nr:FAD-dependent oxidoreductase [Deltaproteobacteria bacterium]
MNALNSLLSPIKIKSMELNNRAVMPPMGTNLSQDETVSDANLAYIKRMAEGGAGLIISEIACVHPSGSVGNGHLGVYDDKFIPGLKKMAQAIHKAGTKTALQLHHAGRESIERLLKGEAIGPSAVPSLVYRKTPKEMTLEDIQMIVQSFGQAAIRAQEAGFDAVEIHGAHGYLLTQFLSSIANKREDEYGGSFTNRARFMIEVVTEVRRTVGNDFPVLLRISAEEFIKTGYTVEDVLTILPDLVTAGVDIIHASVGTHGSPGGVTSASPEYEPGWNVPSAKKIKESANIPVIAVGRFTDPSLADEVIARGDADFVAFGRQQLADPDYLKKAKSGHADDIRKCIACNQGCIERLMLEPGSSIRCAINPETGQELLYPNKPAKQSRNVWVVGAGPAGLTAAFEAKRLGHQVTLFEKEQKAGGQLHYASKAPYKQIYGEWIEWLIAQVEKAGVKIQTQTEVTENMIEKEKPEAVILAIGGEKIIPDIPGKDLPIVCDAWQILGSTVKPGKNVVVVGGGLIGMETADFLCKTGSHVTLFELMERSPVTKFTSHGYMLHKRLREAECKLVLGTAVESIEEQSITINTQGKKETFTPVDQVVLAVGMKPRNNLKTILQENKIQHYVAGDAQEVRRIIEATDEGAKAAWGIK